jgi:hypothetical protein
VAKRKQSVTLTAAEKAAGRQAEDAHRCGLPMSATTRKHLATARRKLNLLRYGNADAFADPAAVVDHGAAHYH